jgi:hypothetical protein
LLNQEMEGAPVAFPTPANNRGPEFKSRRPDRRKPPQIGGFAHFKGRSPWLNLGQNDSALGLLAIESPLPGLLAPVAVIRAEPLI